MPATSGELTSAEEAAILGLRAQILGKFSAIFDTDVTNQSR